MRAAVVAAALVAALASCASAAGRAALVCRDDLAAMSPQLRKELPQAQRRVEAGPLFEAAVRAHGPARQCSRAAAGTGAQLSWTFAGEATVVARLDPAIESEKVTATLQLALADARKLLQAAEQARFGAGGCGIHWSQPPEEGVEAGADSVLIFRGETCNCQARISVGGQRSVRVSLGSAC